MQALPHYHPRSCTWRCCQLPTGSLHLSFKSTLCSFIVHVLCDTEVVWSANPARGLSQVDVGCSFLNLPSRSHSYCHRIDNLLNGYRNNLKWPCSLPFSPAKITSQKRAVQKEGYTWESVHVFDSPTRALADGCLSPRKICNWHSICIVC